MKIPCLLLGFLLGHVVVFAQITPADSTLRDSSFTNDTISIPKGEVADTVALPGFNIYGDLLNDDPVYNKRYPLWIPAVRVAMTPAVNWVLARYIKKYDWARISPATWKKNLQGPWVWDRDRFGTNFIGHPHTGNYYFNTARSNGYNFWQSFPFAVGGSLLWELFGENEPPSKNDIINTPISGMFLGEVLYRISSNILDERTRGANRVFREILAGVINPPRAFNRLTQGKMFRVTSREVYQEEPLNITISGGLHRVNDQNHFGTGPSNAIFNLQFDYGDPFEIRKRKPFDVFRLRIESRIGAEQKLLDNVMGYGVLFSKNIVKGKHGILGGIFQHFDYWNNQIFELGTIGFGPGILSRVQFGRYSHLYSAFHIGIVPLAGHTTRFGPDTSEFRQYNFGGGFEARIEETFNITRWASLGFNGFFYWIHTYDGFPGNNLVGILKPRIVLNLSRTTSVGFEHHVYYHNRYTDEIPDLHLTRTEQKLFLQIFLEDGKRRGRYH